MELKWIFLFTLFWAPAQVTEQLIILDPIDYQHISISTPESQMSFFLLYIDFLPKLLMYHIRLNQLSVYFSVLCSSLLCTLLNFSLNAVSFWESSDKKEIYLLLLCILFIFLIPKPVRYLLFVPLENQRSEIWSK